MEFLKLSAVDGCNPYAEGRVFFYPLEGSPREGLLQAQSEMVSHFLIGIEHDIAELVTTESAHNIAFSDGMLQAFGDVLYCAVTCNMSVRVIDGFKVIDVYQEQGKLIIISECS